MKPHALAALAALSLAACDDPKPRDVPADPMAAAAPTVSAVPSLKPGMSEGLLHLTELPGFYLDRIGTAQDPLNRQPAVTSSETPIAIDGFAFDPLAKAPAMGVDVVIDGRAYAAAYGKSRPDVASYFKTGALAPTGYALTLPAGSLAKGPHTVAARVIAKDGHGYFESPVVPFVVN